MQKDVERAERYLSERNEKAKRYKIWPSIRDHTKIEMAVFHVNIVRGEKL